MHSLVFRMAITALGVASFYSNSAQSARADEWGCQVILCLANPGGPTQYAECRPSATVCANATGVGPGKATGSRPRLAGGKRGGAVSAWPMQRAGPWSGKDRDTST
jgi:hypothetical protein